MTPSLIGSKLCGQEERDPSSDCARLASGAKAVHRSSPGTHNLNYLIENLGVVAVQLTPADLAEMETTLLKITVHGGRMNKMQMEQVQA